MTSTQFWRKSFSAVSFHHSTATANKDSGVSFHHFPPLVVNNKQGSPVTVNKQNGGEVESTHLRWRQAEQSTATGSSNVRDFQSSGVGPRQRTNLRRTSIDSDLKKQRR
nr:hypothetical protein Itr_chr08CG13450 [Ipomoea trifida]